MAFGAGYCALMLGILSISFSRNAKLVKLCVFTLVVVFSFLVYSDGSSYFDITRFDDYIDAIRLINGQYGAFSGLEKLLSNVPLMSLNSIDRSTVLMYRDQPFVALLCWTVSLFKYNGLLRAITAALFIMCIFRAIDGVKAKSETYMDVNLTYGITVVVFMMYFNFFYLLEGVRNFLSFALLAVVVLNGGDISLVKKILLFVFAVALHPVSLIVVFFYLVSLLKSKVVKNILTVFLLFWSALRGAVQLLIEHLAPIFPPIKRATAYLGSNNTTAVGHVSVKEILSTTLILLIIFGLLIVEHRNLVIIQSERTRWLTKAIFCFTIGSFFNTQVYLRFIMLCLMLSIPAIYLLYQRNTSNRNVYVNNNPGVTYLDLFRFMFSLGAVIEFFAWYLMTYSQGLFI